MAARQKKNTIGSPILPFNNAMDTGIRFNLLSQDGNIRIGQESGIQRIYPFPWRGCSVSTDTLCLVRDATEDRRNGSRFPKVFNTDALHGKRRANHSRVEAPSRRVAPKRRGKRRQYLTTNSDWH